MLEHNKPRIVLSTNHEWIQTGIWNTASVLSADVEEDRAVLNSELVVDPVPLLVSAIVLEVEVVDQVIESLLLEVGHIDLWEGYGHESHGCCCQKLFEHSNN